MKIKIRIATILLLSLTFPLGAQILLAQTPGAKTISKDDVFFTIARRLKQISESPVSAIASELDGVIEVTSITAEPDGRSLVVVRERTPSSVASTNKSTRMHFAPPAAGTNGKEWNWTDFEENRKFYPIDKLFPYAKDELTRRKQATVTKWGNFVTLVGKQRESGLKAVETANAVIKTDPGVLANLITLKAGYDAAITAARDGDNQAIVSVYREIQLQTEAVNALADNHAELKANDAYLRLIDTYKESINQTTNAQKDYLQSVDSYNEILLRLPFALVAYGLGFTKVEASITAE
ncbi:MAG: LemA family protein [Acidobacteriota bacterium]